MGLVLDLPHKVVLRTRMLAIRHQAEPSLGHAPMVLGAVGVRARHHLLLLLPPLLVQEQLRPLTLAVIPISVALVLLRVLVIQPNPLVVEQRVQRRPNEPITEPLVPERLQRRMLVVKLALEVAVLMSVTGAPIAVWVPVATR